ncbi:hypothetical protein ID866_8299 [Astraeus odoratus]|nr:hypothetical protein ID866_8299 [Astraeus odoratus]
MSETAEFRYSLAPFDHSKADVILRSSDNVEFRVFRLLLSLASPFFETFFDLPRPSQETRDDLETKDGLPVIPMSEDGKTLDALLRFCYPRTLAEDPILEDFKNIVNVFEAAKKYGLDTIEQTVCKALFTPKMLEAESLRCFVIARRSRRAVQSKLFAKYSLREPLIPAWFKEIELITSTDLLALLAYHQQCGNAVQGMKSDLSWIGNHYQQWTTIFWIGMNWSRCSCSLSTSNRHLILGRAPVQWWEEFMDSTFQDLRDKPCSDTIRHHAKEAVQTVHQKSCSSCVLVVPGAPQEFTSLFIKKADELIEKVRFLRFWPLRTGLTDHLTG